RGGSGAGDRGLGFPALREHAAATPRTAGRRRRGAGGAGAPGARRRRERGRAHEPDGGDARPPDGGRGPGLPGPRDGPRLPRRARLRDPPRPPCLRPARARRRAGPRHRGARDPRGPPRAGLPRRVPHVRGAGSGRGTGAPAARSVGGRRDARGGAVSKRGIGTRAVHGAKDPRPGPLTTPIVQSSTFVFGSSAEMRRYLEGSEDLYLYTRYENPTLRELEHTLAALEEGEAALVLSSGMAASTARLLFLVKAGDEVLASASLYGGTTRLVREVLPSLG